MDLTALIRKYSTSGPRYTSYPTAPQWKEEVGVDAYRRQLQTALGAEKKPLALYVHLPFCESLCYYCGCNIQITHDHSRSASYLERLVRELGEVARLVGSRREISQVSWGGGTPTFLPVEEMERLQQATRDHFAIVPDAEVSIEIDPRVTSSAQLERLRALGFNRVSMGVQDFDPAVQQAVNRVQPAEATARMLAFCRSLGFGGINFDLIYGLPHQSLASFEKTIGAVLEMLPDRIALYNYARLPSLLKHQGILEKYPMPSAEERVDIFGMAYERLTAHGYADIGMDHFARREDELHQALTDGRLYRNFMGYTVKRGTDMIGIGASAIGEVGDAYFQNRRAPKEYEAAIDGSGLATLRGCLLTEDDRRRKWIIQSLMCRFRLAPAEYQGQFGEPLEERFQGELARLEPFTEDRILEREAQGWRVTELGRVFLRNVAMVFDAYLQAPRVGATFSQTV